MIGRGERAAGKQMVVWWWVDGVRCGGDGGCLTAWQLGHASCLCQQSHEM